jgi:hypothetical protein
VKAIRLGQARDARPRDAASLAQPSLVPSFTLARRLDFRPPAVVAVERPTAIDAPMLFVSP